jgi:SAM-dependent methyltransferase
MLINSFNIPPGKDRDNHIKIISEGLMNLTADNRFENFFADDKYITLKNYLYNYLLRKYAVEKSLADEKPDMILELGCGISPTAHAENHIVYSDLSFLALQTLKQNFGKGMYVVADGMKLPFRPGCFSHVISSEVLEHLEDDRKALAEIVVVMKPGGVFVITFPHRKLYFAYDDRFVKHFRRYELAEMEDRLREAGLHPVSVRKVLGPLEKITMCMAIFFFSMVQRFHESNGQNVRKRHSAALSSLFKWINMLYAGLAWLDAGIMPRSLSTVLLVKSVKKF